jgi:hypothetical protein
MLIARRKSASTLFRSSLLTAAVTALLTGGLGCGTNWHSDSQSYLVPYENGDFKTAAAESLHCAHNSVATDALLFNLEAGTVVRASGDIGQANSRLDDADVLVGDYEQWPDVSISEETVAALTNARSTNYRGKMSDLVMMNTYRALNHMEMGHNNGARAMLLRAYFVQTDIATKYAADLQKEDKATDDEKKKDSTDFDTDKSVAAAKDKTKDQYKDLLNLKSYAAYINPFCDYVQGIYFLGAAVDQNDKDRAYTAFNRAASMEPTNAYIKQDVADANSAANGKKLPPITYVIFETGMSPEIGQVKVDLPLFVINKQVPNIALNFPYLIMHGDYVPYLSVEAGGKAYQTVVVSDMDSVIGQEFKNTLPMVTQRMIISAATKAAIEAGVRQAAKKNMWAGLATDVVSLGYNAVTNQADLRTWRTLPKQYQIARFITPADHKLRLAPNDLSGQVEVALQDGPVNVVYAKSVRKGVGLVVRQFVVVSDEKKDASAATKPAVAMH